jgi:DNA polymerase/3'-5' exonuclease PolX
MSTNTELAERFRGIADILDLKGERFKPEAYRRAARSIESLAEDIRRVAGRGELATIPGVGAAISEKIEEYLREGRIDYYDRLQKELPAGLLEIVRLPGLGPKTARRFWVELGIEGPAELTAAIEAGRLTGLSGFGPRKIELIRTALATASPGPARRVPLLEAWQLAERILARLRANAPVDQAEVAGSLRRRRESVGDLDLLVTSRDAEKVFDAFTALPERIETRLRGPTKETILVTGGVQVDLRVVDPASFGAALQYFTGSKDHNVQIRSLARDQGLKVNEYGVDRGADRVAGGTEEEVYRSLGLPYFPPEIREGHGEIEAAQAGRLPRLVGPEDIRGDLHVHLPSGTGEQVAAAVTGAAAAGWSYLGFVVPGPEIDSLRATLARLKPASVRCWVGEEISAAELGSAPPSSADYRVVRADGPTVPDERSAGGAQGAATLLLGHLVTGAPGDASDHERAEAWTGWARRRELAIDVTARGAAEGLDSVAARRAVDAGATLHVSIGVDPAEGGTLALGLARRAWVGPTSVLNALTATALEARLHPAAPRRRRSG